ncbi:MAG: helix-turn-helix domain-containing protein [Hylemonella sp.]|nr:helix-turn-helix domain-containing protein [Hylemonella sp.]
MSAEFVFIRDLRDLVRRKLPSPIPGGQDLLIDLAAAQHLGRNLTMKELVLARGGSATTIRRKVQGLIEAGLIIKAAHDHDGRRDQYTVSPSFLKQAADLSRDLKKISVEFERRRVGETSRPAPKTPLNRRSHG